MFLLSVVIISRIYSTNVRSVILNKEFAGMACSHLLVVEVGRAAAAVLGNPVIKVNSLAELIEVDIIFFML